MKKIENFNFLKNLSFKIKNLLVGGRYHLWLCVTCFRIILTFFDDFIRPYERGGAFQTPRIKFYSYIITAACLFQRPRK